MYRGKKVSAWGVSCWRESLKGEVGGSNGMDGHNAPKRQAEKPKWTVEHASWSSDAKVVRMLRKRGKEISGKSSSRFLLYIYIYIKKISSTNRTQSHLPPSAFSFFEEPPHMIPCSKLINAKASSPQWKYQNMCRMTIPYSPP